MGDHDFGLLVTPTLAALAYEPDLLVMAESSGRDRPSAAAAALPARPWPGVELRISRSQSQIQRDGVVPHPGANRQRTLEAGAV